MSALIYLRVCGVPLGIGHLSLAELSIGCAACAAAAAAVESLPMKEIDNITVPLTAALTSWLVFGSSPN